MDGDAPMTQAQGQALVEYAQLTYTAVTSWRRRMAAAALAMAIVVGAMCAFSATQWLSTRDRIAAVPDSALIEGFGVSIPDPRPGLERTQLRVVSLLWGFASGVTGGLALLFLVIYALARPPKEPPHLRAALSGGEPP